MRKGDICIIDSINNIGREQPGRRPIIVISDTKTGMAVIIPLTSNIEALRFPFTITIPQDNQNNLDQESIALIFHIKSIDKSRLSKVVGKIKRNHLDKIDTILSKMLEL